jgi:predicted transcriptional regulator
VRLADEITRQLGQLADHLSQLPPPQAAQVIARVLDPDAGVLGGVTHLVATGSVFAKDQAERGALPAEVWLALGRASNELHDITLDLDEHKDALQHVSTQPATTAAKRPVPAPLVVRRRR